ncbi:conserved hypothetical protein [Thermotomaculum hydrothermale]|uniref:Uncharacterized protein n=1 Tax=Thermotomaculum hydrothermale TaxID=981385 RepID=A0A7R6PYJ0_9BACT|nr:hypothetical protein [Thermotomaculum hydrothermale]BBB31978.1 conserved hypothetical protein [Thermotomaculum hydrothermale]
MKKLFMENIVFMVLTSITIIGGYFFLRYAYKVTDQTPFTQEIVLIFLGTIATILITATLLNKQTEVELKKEQSIKYLDLKSNTYLDLINYIESIILKRNLEHKDIIKLQFLTHRLATVASPNVLIEYTNFLKIFEKSYTDKKIDDKDEDELSKALAKLTIKIREDMIGELDKQSGYDTQEIEQKVIENTNRTIKL